MEEIMAEEQQNFTDPGATQPTQRMDASPAPEEGLTPPPASGSGATPPPPSDGEEGGFWANASSGAKAVIIIGVLILLAGLIWGLFSIVGNKDGGSTEPSITPIPTVAPPTAEAGAPTLVASRDTNIYGGPSTDYPQIGVLQSGLGAEVVGSNQDKSWWAIKFPAGPNGTGWVANGDVKVANADNVPVLNPPPLPTATPVVITDWKGEYFDNTDMKGQPVLVRNDQAINFDWGAGAPAPGLPTDNYSVRWSRKAGFENSDYLFTVNVEGGVRLWLDGRMLIDDWVASGNRTLTAQSGVINAGDHDLRVDYFKSGGVGRINVNWAPIAAAAPVAVIDVPGQITVGQPAQFSGQRSAAADGRKIVTYQWDFGDGAGSNDVNPVYTYNKAGNYTVTLAVIDDLGQKGETKVGVTVQAPAPPVAVIGGPMAGMVGDTLAYSGADSHGSLPIVRYEWDFGDGQTAAGVRVNHAYQNAGAYRVMLTVTDEAGQQGASTLDVTITGVPPTETPVPQPTVGPTATPPGQEILGAWSMTSRAQGRQAPIELLPGTQITLVLATDGTYSGNGGCNTYQGTYQLLGPSQIQFGPMSQSQKICDQPIMAQETDYFMSLLKAEAFSVTGSKMQLNTSDNWTLFYDRAP
jgi:heat shock protein HslJ/chitodextrinase/uncharacterized protein YraI